MTISSLEDLNTYSLTPITYDDIRPAQVLFDRGATVPQALTISENNTYVFPWGINIEDITQYDVALVEYEIDLSNHPTPVNVSWNYLPSHVTVTRVNNVWTVSGIRSRQDWLWVRQARVQPPFGFTGLITHTGSISFFANSASVSRTVASWTVSLTVTAIEYFSAAPPLTYTANQNQTNISTTTIIADPEDFNPVWTLRISASDTTIIDEIFSDGTPAEAAWNNSTKQFVITGATDDVNDVLSTLDIDFARKDANFQLNFVLANNFTSTIETQVQIFESRDFISDVVGIFSQSPVTLNVRWGGRFDHLIRANITPQVKRIAGLSGIINSEANVNAVANFTTNSSADLESQAGIVPNITRVFSLSADLSSSFAIETDNTRIRFGESELENEVTLTSNAYTHQGGLVATFDTIALNDLNELEPELRFENFKSPRLTNSIDIDWIRQDGSITTQTIQFTADGLQKSAIYPGGVPGYVTAVIKGDFRNVSIKGLSSLDRWSDSTTHSETNFQFYDVGHLPPAIPSNMRILEFIGQSDGLGTLFNASELITWDMSNFDYFGPMFRRCTSFNQPIGNWNTSNVTDMSGMFNNCNNFNQNIGNWNTSNVTNMDGMFNGAGAFDQNISGWCVELIPSKPTNFDLNTPATWIAAEKPDWGALC